VDPKFLHKFAELVKPLREIATKDKMEDWGDEHTKVFEEINRRLSQSPVLAHYDPRKATRVSADSSSYGLVATLEQLHKDRWRPVCYASRSLTKTERNYAMGKKRHSV